MIKSNRLIIGLTCFIILLISTIIYKCSDNNKIISDHELSLESRIYDDDHNKKELQKALKLAGVK